MSKPFGCPLIGKHRGLHSKKPELRIFGANLIRAKSLPRNKNSDDATVSYGHRYLSNLVPLPEILDEAQSFLLVSIISILDWTSWCWLVSKYQTFLGSQHPSVPVQDPKL